MYVFISARNYAREYRQHQHRKIRPNDFSRYPDNNLLRIYTQHTYTSYCKAEAISHTLMICFRLWSYLCSKCILVCVITLRVLHHEPVPSVRSSCCCFHYMVTTPTSRSSADARCAPVMPVMGFYTILFDLLSFWPHKAFTSSQPVITH